MWLFRRLNAPWDKHQGFNWLVVYLPLWKIWLRQLGWWLFPTEWKVIKPPTSNPLKTVSTLQPPKNWSRKISFWWNPAPPRGLATLTWIGSGQDSRNLGITWVTEVQRNAEEMGFLSSLGIGFGLILVYVCWFCYGNVCWLKHVDLLSCCFMVSSLETIVILVTC